jgi:hypothetical protein
MTMVLMVIGQPRYAPSCGTTGVSSDCSAMIERRFVSELRLDQLAEESAAAVELVERPAFDNASLLEHQDTAGIAYGRQPVRDDEGGSSFHRFIERLRDALFGHWIERAGRLVEDENRRVFEECARHCKPLAFAAGQQAPAFADARLETVRLVFDEVECLRAGRGFTQLRLGGVGFADAQVFGDGAVEQKRLLKNHADIAP